jgi:preflagellin peptidase FlaK
MVFAIVKVALTLTFLVYASWNDYKTREVSNRVWMFFAPIAFALSLAELLLYDIGRLPRFGLVLGVITAFALLLFYAGGFGGADSKALICIAIALPFFPDRLLTPLFVEGLSPLAQNIFPFTIFSNSILVAAGSVLVMLLVNTKQRLTIGKRVFEGTLAAESIWKKILVLMTGYKVPLARLQEKWHVYPLEDIIEEENGETSLKRKLLVMPKDEGREEIVKRLSGGVASGKIDSHVFATPGLPMLIFITVGLIISLFFGDIVWLLIRLLAG